MSKGKVIGFRVSEDLHKKLMESAEAEGSTISDVARNIITEHVRNEDILQAIQEMKLHLSQGVAQGRGGSVVNGDLAEVRRIVTLIARAMPAVAKQV